MSSSKSDEATSASSTPATGHASAPTSSSNAASSAADADDLLVNDDLRDVFRILYDDGGDDGEAEEWSEDEKQVEKVDAHPPMHEQVPHIDLPDDAFVGNKKRSKVSRMTTKRAERALAWLASGRPGVNGEKEEPGPASKKRRRNVDEPFASSSTSADPLSVTAYHARLLTFGASTFSSKPSTLNAANIARYGWTHEQGEEEGLGCATCGVRWSLKGVDEALDGRGKKALSLSEELRQKLVRLLTEKLATAHRETCVWRTHQSPKSISQWLLARHPQSSIHLSAVAMHIQRRYFESSEDDGPDRAPLTIKHPLSSKQASHVVDNMQRGRALHLQWADDAAAEQHVKLPVISEPAATLAMFGWSPHATHLEEILHCELCDRKIGLWLFRGKRPLAVVMEHRDFCPIRREGAGSAWWWVNSPLLRSAPSEGGDKQDVKTYQADRVAHARAVLKQLTQPK